jgi:hypothetical protein
MNKPMEWYRMKVSEMQRRLANKAMREPEHRFINLFDFLTWEPLMEWAFDKLMTNRGSRTAGIDGLDKRTAIRNKEQILHDLRAALKSGTYQHQPVRRVYIPKGNGKQRPLGIPIVPSYCTSYRELGDFGSDIKDFHEYNILLGEIRVNGSKSVETSVGERVCAVFG